MMPSPVGIRLQLRAFVRRFSRNRGQCCGNSLFPPRHAYENLVLPYFKTQRQVVFGNVAAAVEQTVSVLLAAELIVDGFPIVSL